MVKFSVCIQEGNEDTLQPVFGEIAQPAVCAYVLSTCLCIQSEQYAVQVINV